jgi:hypothetical protein
MGHSSITTTLRYVHRPRSTSAQPAEKLGQFNIEQLFARVEHGDSLQKSLQ